MINLVVIIGIIALLSTLSIPYLKRYQPNLKLNGVARDLTSDLRYAQQLTITEQIVHEVHFDFSNDRYDIFKIDTATTTVKSVDFPAEVSYLQIIDLTGNKVVFNSYGGVSESGQIVLVNTESKQATIYVKPSGYIQLSQ